MLAGYSCKQVQLQVGQVYCLIKLGKKIERYAQNVSIIIWKYSGDLKLLEELCIFHEIQYNSVLPLNQH